MVTRAPNARGAGDQLRTELVAAASELLTTAQPISLPSLRAVARACGVSPSAVYLHFDSRLALVRAVVDAHLASLRERVLGHPHDATPRGRIIAVGQGYAAWALEHPGAYQLIFETAPQAGVVSQQDPASALVRVTADLLAEARGGKAEGSLEDALILWASAHGLVLLRIHKPHLHWPRSLDDDVVRLVDALLPGVR